MEGGKNQICRKSEGKGQGTLALGLARRPGWGGGSLRAFRRAVLFMFGGLSVCWFVRCFYFVGPFVCLLVCHFVGLSVCSICGAGSLGLRFWSSGVFFGLFLGAVGVFWLHFCSFLGALGGPWLHFGGSGGLLGALGVTWAALGRPLAAQRGPRSNFPKIVPPILAPFWFILDVKIDSKPEPIFD